VKKNGWIQIVFGLLLILSLIGCRTPAPTPTVAVAPTATAAPTNTPEAAAPSESDGQALILATTTSTENSGLLEYLLPDFEAEYGVEVDVIAVGTGQALALGEAGDADVLMVHARAREDAFMEAGHGVRREDLMYNDFVIVGPADDPAGIAGMTDAAAALAQISEAEAPFVSRGDDSGTHTKERAIWQAAGVAPSGGWYISAGQGMGAVLTMADEQQTYTLSDRATYLARTLEGTELQILVEGDPILFNPYGVMVVNPDKGEHIRVDLANTFVDWLISVETQEQIGQFGVEQFGAPLFTPDSALWREAHPDEASKDEGASGGIPTDAALKITGMVENEIGWTEDQVRAMETMEAESTNKAGETSTYTGVSINALLELAGLQEDATTLTFVADDGYTADVELSEMQVCSDCIVSFRNQGGFSIVMPGFPGNLQVKGVIEMQVK
jgi:tungstate transport system substrate-binding protein